MKKNEREERDRSIVLSFVAGASLKDLGHKYGLTPAGVSRVIQDYKKTHPVMDSKTRAELSQCIVGEALCALALIDFSEIHPETLLKIIERLTAIYGQEEANEQPVTVNIRFCDTSKPREESEA